MSEPKLLNRLSPNRLLLSFNMGLANILSFIVRIFKRGVALKWAILVFAVFFCALIGWCGFLSESKDITKSEALYRSLQLFVLGSGADAHGAKLQFARFFAVIVSVYAVLLTLLQCFIDRIRLYLPRLWSRHVIIAGLGSTGIQLVESFKKKNRPRHVVVIEHDESNVNIKTAESYGAIVLCGDASDPLMLKHAGIATARYLICGCREDETNLDIAMQASRILDRSFRHKTLGNLKAYIHFADMAFYHLLFSHWLFTTRIDRLDIKTFNYFETAARLLMLTYPLERGKQDWEQGTVHLIIAGFGAMGEALLLQVAKTAHFANASKKTLRITILDKDEKVLQNKSDRLVQTLSMEKICDFELLNEDVENPAVRARMTEWANNKEVTAAIAICLDNEHFSAFCALELSRQVNTNVPIFIHISKKKGLARLFTGLGSNALKIKPDSVAHIIPFGMPEETSTPETLIDKELDILARAVYEDYQEKTKGPVRKWEDLEEWELISNRAQADHISVKLRAVNCYSASHPKDPGDPQIHQFCNTEIEIMSKMEHNRWNAERFLTGWKRYTGPVPWENLSVKEQVRIKNELHQSPYLVDWADLPEKIKDYDRNAVKNIFHILKRIHLNVYQNPD